MYVCICWCVCSRPQECLITCFRLGQTSDKESVSTLGTFTLDILGGSGERDIIVVQSSV